MSVAKVVIRMDQEMLTQVDRLVKQGVFPSRSKAIQQAVEAQLIRMDRGRRLARECAKLDSKAEAAMAEKGMAWDFAEWPEY